MRTLDELARTPNALAAHYARFRVGERLLLTGHSHQAWPDVAFEGQDEKWSRAEEKAERVRRGYARLLGDRDGVIALGQNTHELLLRFLSALPLRDRPRLVTTDGEFHTIRRQLDRLAEDRWLEVMKVAAEPAGSLAGRLAGGVNSRTAAVLTSSVLYATAHIVPGLGEVAETCRREGAELLVDVYHHLNVVPFSLAWLGLEDAFVIGGGYKYCQLGEGNCFLRVPPGRTHVRPVVTGWFGEFARLAERAPGVVPYGDGPARWAGATYDPTSHYRAARVLDFFESQGLTPEFLREVSQHQVGLLGARFDALELGEALTRDRSVPLERTGGFLALRGQRAFELSERLRRGGVLTDARGEWLRLGPAPYLSDGQLHAAMDALDRVARDRPHEGAQA
ncbi:MAG: kynureninase [Candidatus Eisenbacteria bacterium]|uniref:Kynureninase n=1 Tax=Eiseniibacteriota bacterium TaxID=2212470 RepID=A0A538TK27_UNCEI|nr:MAG: kynureninase [Candidatus Eisenbacteria bacterium]